MADRVTSFRPSPENKVYLDAVENKNDFINSVLTKIRTGQLVDAASITEGKAEFNCIFKMPTLDDADQTCPVKVDWPALCATEEESRGNLLAHCRLCPRRHEYLALQKHKLKYPKVFEQLPDAEGGYEPPEPVKKAEDITLQCDDCPQTVSLSDFQHLKSPVLGMQTGLLYHVRNTHGRYRLSAKEWPPHMVQRLKAE